MKVGRTTLLFEKSQKSKIDFDQLFVYTICQKNNNFCLHFSDNHHHHKSHDDKYKDKHGNGSTSSSSSKDKNTSKSAKLERQSSKVEEIDAKIREKSIKSFKSEKLNSFDMFAPKAPKPKLVMPKPMEIQKPTTPSTPIINSPSVSSSLPKSPVSKIF